MHPVERRAWSAALERDERVSLGDARLEIVDAAREPLEHRILKEIGRTEIGAEHLVHTLHQAHREKGVAADQEKVVIGRDGRRAQQLLPEIHQPLLRRGQLASGAW